MQRFPDNNDFRRLRKICEKAGMRLTHQRWAIYQELMNTSGHRSTEDIFNRLQKRIPTIALDTVYRTLDTYAALGIARKLHLTNMNNLFDTNVEPHHHFICASCQLVADVSWPEFDQIDIPHRIADIGTAQWCHLEIHGLCMECQKKLI